MDNGHMRALTHGRMDIFLPILTADHRGTGITVYWVSSLAMQTSKLHVSLQQLCSQAACARATECGFYSEEVPPLALMLASLHATLLAMLCSNFSRGAASSCCRTQCVQGWGLSHHLPLAPHPIIKTHVL